MSVGGELKAKRAIKKIEDKKREIASQAIDLMRETGYHNMSMDVVAERVGLTKPTLYSYISSKQELLFYILESAMTSGTKSIKDIILQSKSARIRLREALSAYVELILNNSNLFYSAFTEHNSLTDEHQLIIRKMQSEFLSLWKKLYEEGVLEGSFEKMPTKVAIQMLLGVMHWIPFWNQEGDKSDQEENLMRIVNFCEKGLLKKEE